MERTVGGLKIECVVGDITGQDGIDAIVNAANRHLTTGGGVAGAIHRAAGPGLEKEAVPLGPIEPGQAVITGGHDLPNPYVIHCLGPRYGLDEPSAELLAACYRHALQLAEQHRLASVAFPAISTGIFGYPLDEAAGVAIGEVARIAQAGSLRSVRLVRFVLNNSRALRAHEAALAALVS